MDPTLAELNDRLRTLTTNINVLYGFHGPIPLANHVNLNGNRIINVGTPTSPTDALSQTSADPMYSTAVQRKAMEAVGSQMLQTTRRLNDGSQQHAVSSDLNLQGAIPPTITGQTVITSTASTITVAFPTQIQYGDLSIIAIPNAPITVTGVAGSGYVYPYYDTVLGVGTLVTDSVNATGVPPVLFALQNATAAQVQNADGHVPLSNGGISVTVAGGGGGGGRGGGSGCIRAGMVVETQSRGVISIEAVYIGDMIRARTGWTCVKGRRVGDYNVFVRVSTSNGECVDVTPTHPICLFPGGQKEAGELNLGDVLCGPEGIPLQILSLLTVHDTAPIVLLSCDPTHEYLVGRFNPTIVAHNQIPLK